MISLLPKDGKTVDLLEWWYRFTLDASTEYLFGESVNSLLNPKVPSFPSCTFEDIDGRLHSRMRFPEFKNINLFKVVWAYSGVYTNPKTSSTQ